MGTTKYGNNSPFYKIQIIVLEKTNRKKTIHNVKYIGHYAYKPESLPHSEFDLQHERDSTNISISFICFEVGAATVPLSSIR